MLANQEPFLTKRDYAASRSAITVASLNWLIFNKRRELEDAGAITYLGRKILITPEMDKFILSGGTKIIGGNAR
jgi:hypothetical protein